MLTIPEDPVKKAAITRTELKAMEQNLQHALDNIVNPLIAMLAIDYSSAFSVFFRSLMPIGGAELYKRWSLSY